MFIQIRHPIFKNSPKEFSILTAWDIAEAELSPTGKKSVEILDQGDLKDADLYKNVA